MWDSGLSTDSNPESGSGTGPQGDSNPHPANFASGRIEGKLDSATTIQGCLQS